MDRNVLRIFQAEVELQCTFILGAFHELNAALVTKSSSDVWRHLQTILVASASVSKMLWGSAEGSSESRRLLRESLEVSEESVLRDVKLRNDFEHFDERLERWFATSEHRNYVGRIVGPIGQLVYPPQPLTDQFQQFDPETGAVAFWDHTVSLPDVVNEASRIRQIARAEVRKPPWDSPPEPQAEAKDSPPQTE